MTKDFNPLGDIIDESRNPSGVTVLRDVCKDHQRLVDALVSAGVLESHQGVYQGLGDPVHTPWYTVVKPHDRVAQQQTNKLTRPAIVVDAKNVVLGETYTDSVTGITGVAVIVYVHLTGCDQVCLSLLDKDGKQDYHTVDVSRLAEPQQVDTPRPGPGGPSGVPTRGPGRP